MIESKLTTSKQGSMFLFALIYLLDSIHRMPYAMINFCNLPLPAGMVEYLSLIFLLYKSFILCMLDMRLLSVFQGCHNKTIRVPVFIGGAGSQGALSGMLEIGIESGAQDF